MTTRDNSRKLPKAGILVIDKPAGVTSREAVNCVQRLVRPNKVGHAGTLDPLATGVLVMCIGNATRLIRYIQEMPKRYRATFRLGVTSETDDTESPLTDMPAPREPTRREMEAALGEFRGEISQTPPRYSALKLQGRRAYDLARQNVEFQLEPRPVTIYHLELMDYQYPTLVLEIQCSSGTYVRSLGRDLGRCLESGAVMSALRRTAIGKFVADQACPLEKLSPDTLGDWLLSARRALDELPEIRISAEAAALLRQGRPISVDPSSECGVLITTRDRTEQDGRSTGMEMVALDEQEQLVAIVQQKSSGLLQPRKCFPAE